MQRINTGDWVQALRTIREANFNFKPLWTHARPGDVGHVLDVDADGWPCVYWERSGTSTDVDPESLKVLCDAFGVLPKGSRPPVVNPKAIPRC